MYSIHYNNGCINVFITLMLQPATKGGALLISLYTSDNRNNQLADFLLITLIRKITNGVK